MRRSTGGVGEIPAAVLANAGLLADPGALAGAVTVSYLVTVGRSMTTAPKERRPVSSRGGRETSRQHRRMVRARVEPASA